MGPSWKHLETRFVVEAPLGLLRAMLALAVAGCLAVAPLAAQESAEPWFSSPTQIEERLLEADGLLRLTEAQGDEERLALARAWQVALVQHLEAARYLETLQADAVGSEVGSTALPTNPPYSFQLADRLRHERDRLRLQVEAVEERLDLVTRTLEDTRQALAEANRALRAERETSGPGPSTASGPDAERRIALSELNSWVLAERAARLDLRREGQTLEQEMLVGALAAAEQAVGALRGQVVLGPSEREALEAPLLAERDRLRASLLDDHASDRARQRSWKLDFIELELAFTDALAALGGQPGERRRRALLTELEAIHGQALGWLQGLESYAAGRARDAGGAPFAERPGEELERVRLLADRTRFVLEDLYGDQARGEPLTRQAADALAAVWNAELYLAEEVASLGGRKVTQFRPVTTGKMVRLVVILLVGWLLIRLLAALVRGGVARLGAGRPAQATAGRWVFGLGMGLLIIFALNRVHIPFTAFAFLGGTLAIGIGFGAQTVLKNFISGIILKLERPFRVNDLVQMGDTSGFIRAIGLRASVVEHIDGVETLVPNSVLLENAVSNWTFGGDAVRGEVAVGVAYGSPTVLVTDLLIGVARDHARVLDEPPPSVRFDDFGESTLQFRLLFWFDARGIRREKLASELRYAIADCLEEAGIELSYPQRDINFKRDQPLRVEVLREADPPERGSPP